MGNGGIKMGATPRGVDNVKVIEVIETKALKGKGTEENPVRYVYQYWDFGGNLLAERDYIDEENGYK